MAQEPSADQPPGAPHPRQGFGTDSRRMGRRTLLRGAGGLAVVGIGAGVLPLFSTPDRHQNPASCRATDVSARDKTLTVSNWPIYIDSDSKHYTSTLTAFKQEYGVKVNYYTDVTDNVVFFNKVVNQLGSCAPTGRDMFKFVTLGIAMGCDLVRVGFEDGIHLPDGSVARDNAEMVKAAADIAAFYGAKPATVEEARKRFGIG